MTRELEYDPSVVRAVLRPDFSDWCLLLERADATPVQRTIFAHDEIANAVGEDNLSDAMVVIGYIEQCLIAAGYTAELQDAPLPRPFIGAWALGPTKE